MANREERTRMWVDSCALLERAEQMHRQFFGLGPATGGGPAWQPPVDMFENDHELAIEVALPGVATEAIELLVEPGAIVVRGARRLSPEFRAAAVHRLEIPHGLFERRISLPPGRYALAEQAHIHGCLRLSLRKLR
jgi:HSP20 family molecular chaperone IbpA